MRLITLERVYEKTLVLTDNNYLVDRLWPRGVSKVKLTGVVWLKEVAPSNQLRQWYHQHLDQWTVFYHHYQQELENNLAVMMLYQKLIDHQSITLLYGSKDANHNHAIVLRDFLLNKLKLNNSTS